MTPNNIAFRAILTVLLGLGGLVFPLLFLLAALVGWALVADLRRPPEPESDAWFVRRHTATAADPNWKSYYLPLCESPAETAFLEAMIGAFGLVADKGVLRGSGLTLDLQVVMKPYRVDFLVDDWLVVEIDGAAYHSSPEAVARDQERDRVLQGRGYRVLRIPARVVFSNPGKAVADVRSARAAGRSPAATPGPRPQPAETAVRSLSQIFASINKTVADIGANVARQAAVQQAGSEGKRAFHAERTAIECAFRNAESRLQSEQFCAQSAEHRALYLQARADLEKALSSRPDGASPPASPVIEILPITAPPSHPDPDIDEAIRRAHGELMAHRAAFFAQARQRLVAQSALRGFVENELQQMGCSSCWAHIA